MIYYLIIGKEKYKANKWLKEKSLVFQYSLWSNDLCVVFGDMIKLVNDSVVRCPDFPLMVI